MSHNRQPEALCALRREPVLKHMREHAHAQRDEQERNENQVGHGRLRRLGLSGFFRLSAHCFFRSRFSHGLPHFHVGQIFRFRLTKNLHRLLMPLHRRRMDPPHKTLGLMDFHILGSTLNILNDILGTAVCFFSHSLRDHHKSDNAGEYEDNGLESVRPDCAAHASEKNIGEHDATDDKTGQPRRDAGFAQHPSGGTLYKLAGTDDADE